MQKNEIAELKQFIHKLQKENRKLRTNNQELKKDAAYYEDLYKTTNGWLQDLGRGSDLLLQDLRRVLKGLQATGTNSGRKPKHVKDVISTTLHRLKQYEQSTPLSFLELYY